MNDFVEQVRKSSHKAVEYGKKMAMNHYREATGCSEEEAESFYMRVKQLFSGSSKIVVNTDIAGIVDFLGSGEYRQQKGQKTIEAERALGCPSGPSYASLSGTMEGHRGRGGCSIVLSGVEDSTVLVSGSLNRVRNPDRKDYVSDPSFVTYSYEDAAHCRAAAAICATSLSELVSGPEPILEKIDGGELRYDKCEALVFGRLTPKEVLMLVADKESSAAAIRGALEDMGKIMPVAMIKGPDAVAEEGEEDRSPDEGRQYSDMLRPGGRVAMKPSPTNPRVVGTVLESSDGVVVQWDNSERVVYDMTEAFARLMPAPGPAPSVDGMVVYAMPGMDDDTVHTLASYGIDPVNVYSVVSHAKPPSSKSSGWEDHMINALAKVGVKAVVVQGFAYSDDDPRLAFKPKKWLEAGLPDGNRLVIDVAHNKVLVTAGEAEDYIVPSRESGLLFE